MFLKKKSLFKFFSICFVAISLFAFLLTSVSAFTFQNDVGLPKVPYVTQNYGQVVNGENVYEYPIAYAPFEYRYVSNSSNTLQSFQDNYRNYLQLSTLQGLQFLTDSWVYYDPANFIITTIDFGYSNTLDALYSVSVESESLYILNGDFSQTYKAGTGGGWIFFVFADSNGAITEFRLNFENGDFEETFYLGNLYDSLLAHFGSADAIKYLLQVQIKQNYFSGTNVPNFVPMARISSTVTIGKNFLEQFQDAYLDLVNDELYNSYANGYLEGEQNGYSSGYNYGYDLGFQDGFELGEQVVDDGFYGWLIEALDAFLNSPLFYVYETPVSLGGLCGIFVGVSVVIWVLKLIAGG